MAQLCRDWERFIVFGARAAVITFGARPLARAWLRETQVPFPVWLDPRRAAYRAFGLQRSLVRSWNLRTLLTYARLLSQGRRWRGIQGDSGQLGGDFVVDSGGVVRLAYPSRDPADRPALDDLLDAFQQLAG